MGTKWKDNKNWPEGFRGCTKCGEIKQIECFHKHKGCYGGYNSVCKTCRLPQSKKNYQGFSDVYRLWYSAKSRAKRKNRSFSIEESDIRIPEVCPILGTKFIKNTEYAASIDRIDSTKGYIKGNIQVISRRANMIKSNATIEEIQKVLDYMRRM